MADLVRRIVAEYGARNKAKGATMAFRRDMDSAGRAMRRLATGALALAGVGGFGYMIKKQMEVIDSTAKLSRRLNISTEDLVTMQHGAKIAGVEQETFNKSLEIFVRRLGEVDMGVGQAKYALDKLGLDYKELIGLSADEAFGRIADQIKGLATQAEKAAAANYLFGRSGQALLNLFEEGSKGLKRYKEFLEKIGKTFSDLDAAQVEAANDALTNVRATMEGIFTQATIQLAPYIEILADKFVDAATAGEGLGANVVNAFESMSMAAIRFGGLIQTIPAYWKGVEAGAHESLAGVYELADAATNLDVLFKKLKRPGWEKTYKELAQEQRQIAADLSEEGGRILAGTYGQENAVERYFESLRKKTEGRAVAGVSPAEELSLLPPPPESDRERKSAIEGIIKYVAATEKEIEIAKRVAQGHLYAAKMIGLENELKKAGIEGTASATATIEAYTKRLDVLQQLKDKMAAKKQQEEAARDVERILDGMQRELDMVGQVGDTWDRSREFADLHAKAIEKAAGNMEEYNSIMAKGMDIFEKYRLAERWAEMSRSMESSFSSAMERMIFEGQKFGDAMKTVIREVLMEAIRIQFIRPQAQALAGFMGAGLGALFGGGGAPTVPTQTQRSNLGGYGGGYQHGGIATRPHLAMVGDVPEAFVPLRGGKIPVEMRGGGERSINVHIHNEYSEEGERREISRVESYIVSDQRIVDVFVQRSQTDAKLRRSIVQAR